MLSVKEIITNVVFNDMNQMISKDFIHDLLNEIILTQEDDENPLFRLIGHSRNNVYYVCFTHNLVIVINTLINYLNHLESEEDEISMRDITSSIVSDEYVVYECFVNSDVSDEYSPLISATNSLEVINIQSSLPDMSGMLEIDDKNIIDRNEENKSCLLCYENSEYCCSVCKYPLCESCLNVLNNSSCKCPCCQMVPLKMIKIDKEK